METHTFFLYLLIILLTVRIFAELAVRLKAPSVIGELLALLFEFSMGSGISFINAGKVLVFVAVFFLLARLAAKLMSLMVKRVDDASRRGGFDFCRTGQGDWYFGQ